jgi:plasmid stabilization system protein ParE
VRDTNDLQTTLTLGPVNRVDPTLSLELGLQMAFPMPNQDEPLPDRIEAFVHQAGLELQRRLFQAFVEKADQEPVLQRRQGKGGAGIRLRGTRPFTFKTTFGAVTVPRSRIEHKKEGTIEVPSARAWNTSHQRHITRNLRDAAWDQMSDPSTGKSRADVCQDAGDEDLLGRSTIIDLVPQEGEPLVVAQRARARAVLDGASEAQLAWLGPAAVDPDARTGSVEDDPPFDDSEDAQAEWELTQAEWIATGFPGCEPAFPVAQDGPRAVDEGFVIVEPDEVKTEAQPSTGRKEVWTYTAVVLVGGSRYALAEASVEGLWLQVSALLLELGVLNGARRLLVLGDGATWIRTWFEGLGISLKAMILCWWHLRKRCYESMSSAGGPKDRRRAFEKELLGQLWEGKVETAIALLRGTLEWVRNPTAVEELIAYLEKRRAYIPNYQQRQEAGLWIASTRVEKYNDWAVSARCKHQGMSWSPQGVLALAALEAARRNGELDDWRRDRALPERALPEPIRKAA